MSNIRQTILVRTDLGFSQGLMAAQVAHIHMQLLREYILRHDMQKTSKAELQADFKTPLETNNYLDWLKSPYVFVHGVPNPEALDYFMKKAKEINIPVATWTDTVFMDLAPEMTNAFSGVLIGCSLGPCDSDLIKSVIGKLPLL